MSVNFLKTSSMPLPCKDNGRPTNTSSPHILFKGVPLRLSTNKVGCLFLLSLLIKYSVLYLGDRYDGNKIRDRYIAV